jgi:hypothetical protein
MEIPFNLPSGQQKLEDFQAASRGFLLKSMGISHTHDTKVGNEFVGGVLGGDENQSASSKPSQPEEEERVLLRQQQPWSGCKHSSGVHQNHPRLDGHFLSRLCSHVIPAGNGIYNLFDKVLVIDEGEEIYYGPMMKARPFLESLGFYSNDGANVADYLTGATVPSERKIIQGFEASFPRTADDIQRIWKPSTTTPLQTKRNPD